jgi:hypothetical protein
VTSYATNYVMLPSEQTAQSGQHRIRRTSRGVIDGLGASLLASDGEMVAAAAAATDGDSTICDDVWDIFRDS